MSNDRKKGERKRRILSGASGVDGPRCELRYSRGILRLRCGQTGRYKPSDLFRHLSYGLRYSGAMRALLYSDYDYEHEQK